MHDTVSVLIPAYNRSEYITDCIDSVFTQTYKNFRVIIYDDGSSDNTTTLIKKFIKNLTLENKKKISLIENTYNKGVGYARNVLLSQVDTNYACWQDSDDTMIENRLERQLCYLKENDLDIVYCYMDKINESGEVTGKIEIDTSKYNSNPESLKYNVTCPTGFFRSYLKKYTVPESLQLGSEDIIWLYQLIKDNIKVGCCNESLYHYRYHPDRIGENKRNEKIKPGKNMSLRYLVT